MNCASSLKLNMTSYLNATYLQISNHWSVTLYGVRRRYECTWNNKFRTCAVYIWQGTSLDRSQITRRQGAPPPWRGINNWHQNMQWYCFWSKIINYINQHKKQARRKVFWYMLTSVNVQSLFYKIQTGVIFNYLVLNLPTERFNRFGSHCFCSTPNRD